MSLNLASFATQNREAAAPVAGANGSRAPREDAKLWLNFGFIKHFTNEQGEADQTFVTIARGIPVDQIEDWDLSKIRNSNMATLRRDQNRFRAAIMGEAEKLAPGESKMICFDDSANLGVELRRVGEAAQPVDDGNEPLGFTFRT